jgi:thioesterase domain-containing protein/acyl carrier protein
LTQVGHRLRLIGPKSGLDDEIRMSISEHREAIVDLIMSENIPASISLPLTNIQQRMRLEGKWSHGVDHVRSVFKFKGDLDEELLASAAQVIIQQHPTLRMRIEHDNQQASWKLDAMRRFQIDSITTDSDTSPEKSVQEYIERPFPLNQNMLFRIGILGSGHDEQRQLVVVVHHALADGHGSGMLLTELASIYAELKSGRLPNVESGDSGILEQLRIHHDENTTHEEQHLQEWIESLGDDSRGSMLPCDEGEDGAERPSFALCKKTFGDDDKIMLEEFQAGNSVSMLAMLLAATSILVHQARGEDHALVGLGISKRINKDVERAVANLSADLPLKIDVDPDSTTLQFLIDCQRHFFSSLDRPSVPLEAIIAGGALKPLGRRRLRLPIAIASYERRHDPFEFEDVELERVLNNHPNPFVALGIRLNSSSRDLTINFEWDESIFTTERINRLSDAFMTLFIHMARNPETPISELPFDQTLREGVILETEHGETTSLEGEQRPGSLIESHLASIWSEMLGIFPVQRTSRFFELGGNSLQLIRLIDRIESTLGTSLSIEDFMGDPTLHELSIRVEQNSESLEIPPALWLTKDKNQPRIFCLAGVGGLAAFSYRGVSNCLEGEASLIGIQLPGVGGGGDATKNVAGMAEWVRDAVLSMAQPGEVIRLVGYSAGGVLALEAARLLNNEGHAMAPVILLDTLAPTPVFKRGLIGSVKSYVRQARLARRVKKAIGQNEMLELDSKSGGRLEQKLAQALDQTRLTLTRHQIADYENSIILVSSEGEQGRTRRDAWLPIIKGTIEHQTLPFDHIQLLNEGSPAVAELIKKQLG